MEMAGSMQVCVWVYQGITDEMMHSQKLDYSNSVQTECCMKTIHLTQHSHNYMPWKYKQYFQWQKNLIDTKVSKQIEQTKLYKQWQSL